MNSKTDVKEMERSASAFTFVELLTILMVLAVLCLVLLPALAGSRPANQAFQCLENQRRLVLAWRLYSDDYRGALPPNGGVGATATSMTDPNLNNGNWVHGLMGGFGFWGGETLPGLVQAGSLFPYSKDVKIYKCPADQKLDSLRKTPTVRSMSMNAFMNQVGNPPPGAGVALIYRKQTEILRPGTADCWVFIDESPGTVNDGYFLCDPFANPSQWIDIPAAYHNGAGGISFADGHAEIRKWHDGRLFDALKPNFDNVYPSNPKQSPAVDLKWLQDRSTARK
jgi:prepilin-type processing-associated H-X9-DG protein